MATKILLKKSLTGGAVPLIANLDAGEIAINLVDRKVYSKDGAGAIVRMDGAYIDSTAPANPTEGDIWYDTANNTLKAHNGTGFISAGYATIAALEDTVITSVADGEFLVYDNATSKWINKTLAEADVQPASTLETDVEALFSVTNASGDGSLAYSAGVFTYTGPSASEAQAHFTGGTGVTIVAGEIAIGQAVATTDSVEFANVTAPTVDGNGTTLTLDPSADGANTGEVIIAGDLTVNGTTTSVNSNEVNIGDAIIVLNADETGTASQDAGIEIERGTDANKVLKWNETDDAWDLGGETMQNIILDGGSY